MNREEKIERVESYLAQKMPPGERSSFEKKLEEDPELEDILDTYQISNAMIKARRRQLLKQEMLAKGLALQEATQIRIIRFRRRLAIAASIGILAVFIALFWKNTKEELSPPSSFSTVKLDQVYGEQIAYFPTEKGTSMGDDSETEKLFKQANDLLNQQQYDSTLTRLDRLQQIDPQAFYPKTELMRGYIQLQQEDIQAALKSFASIPKDNPDARTRADWYMALAYVKQQNHQKAVALFWNLAKNPSAGEYQSKAQAVIDKIKK